MTQMNLLVYSTFAIEFMKFEQIVTGFFSNLMNHKKNIVYKLRHFNVY